MNNNVRAFVDYLSLPLSEDEIDNFYKQNNINYNRVFLYREFIFSLIYIINDFYPGSDVMNTEDDNKKHFKFCWDRNIDNFKKEKIYFNNNTSDLYDYIYSVFYDGFYKKDESGENIGTINMLFSYFNECFDIESKRRTQSEMDNFIFLYNLMNHMLIKGKSNGNNGSNKTKTNK